MLTAQSPILATPSISLPAIVAWFRKQPHHGYSESDICDAIVPIYYAQSMLCGIDPIVPLAQLVWETTDTGPNGRGPFQSFWAQRPQRNPAGIAVNGMWSNAWPAPHYPHDPLFRDGRSWSYNTDRHRWEVGASFETWADHSIPSHLGRLLFYATTEGTPARRDVLERAAELLPLPPRNLRGTAPILLRLGSGHNPPSYVSWAGYGRLGGLRYGQNIADTANRMLSYE